jgi:hypothetical protein
MVIKNFCVVTNFRKSTNFHLIVVFRVNTNFGLVQQLALHKLLH